MVLSMERWIEKVAVVTGASAGIGSAIAESLVNEGVIVVGLARRKERVEELARKLSKTSKNSKGKLIALTCDITKDSEIVKAFKWIKENIGPISILINNAGIVIKNTLIDGDVDKWRKVFDTNVLGLCVATKEAVNSMKENNIVGHIIHINSIAGQKVQNFIGFNVYHASKFAVTALCETLRNELNHSKINIKVTSVNPGYTKTDIIETSGVNDNPQAKEIFETIPSLKAEDIADGVVYALSTPPHVLISHLTVEPQGGDVY